MTDFTTEITIGDADIEVLIKYCMDYDALDTVYMFYKGKEINWTRLPKRTQEQIDRACYENEESYAYRYDD